MKKSDTTAALREKGAEAVRLLALRYTDAECSLEYGGDPWRLLVMVRLAAQCTDARVNIVCQRMFPDIPDASTMADTPIEVIEGYIKSCGFYHDKAKSLKEFSRILVEKYDGRVPDTMEELLALPGIGRKTANLILGDVYGKGGVVTDTHCIRICGRLGFYPESLKEPAKVEKILDPLIEKAEQSNFCHRLVHFGREVCTARSPKCGECELAGICAHAQNKKGDDQ